MELLNSTEATSESLDPPHAANLPSFLETSHLQKIVIPISFILEICEIEVADGFARSLAT